MNTTFPALAFDSSDPYLAQEIAEHWLRRLKEERDGGCAMVPIEQRPPATGIYKNKRAGEPLIDPNEFEALKESFAGVFNRPEICPLGISEQMPAVESFNDLAAVPSEGNVSKEHFLTFPDEVFEKIQREIEEIFGPRLDARYLAIYGVKWPAIVFNKGAQPQVENLVGHQWEHCLGSLNVTHSTI